MRRLDFVSFQVTNLEVSKRYYTEKLDFIPSPMSNSEAVIFHFNKDTEAGFAIRKPLNDLGEEPLGKGVSMWFAIDEDIAQLHEKWTANGVSTLGDVINTPFGQAFSIQDPDGYQLTFVVPKK